MKALPCSPVHGYELEYSLNDNIYLYCIYSTVAGAVRNSNKVSWWNILTADDVHMLAWLSVAVQSETQKITRESFKMTTKSSVVKLNWYIQSLSGKLLLLLLFS